MYEFGGQVAQLTLSSLYVFWGQAVTYSQLNWYNLIKLIKKTIPSQDKKRNHVQTIASSDMNTQRIVHASNIAVIAYKINKPTLTKSIWKMSLGS